MGMLKTTITKRVLMDGTSKLYPNIVHAQPIETEALVQYMSEHSQISRAVAYNAVYAFRSLIETFVMNGHTVKIPQIGTFSLSCKAKGVDDEKQANVKHCKPKFKLCFTPTKSIKTMVRSTSFRCLIDDEVQDRSTAGGNTPSTEKG